MAIHWREDRERKWPVIEIADPYDTVHWLTVMKQILEHPSSAPPLRLLIDFRYCTAPPTTFMQRAIDDWETRRFRLSHARIAAVVESDAAQEMARLAEETIEGRQMPLEFRAFRDWDEAERWLAGR